MKQSPCRMGKVQSKTQSIPIVSSPMKTCLGVADLNTDLGFNRPGYRPTQSFITDVLLEKQSNFLIPHFLPTGKKNIDSCHRGLLEGLSDTGGRQGRAR